MGKYNKTKLKIHLKEGLEMETNASPIMRGAIAFGKCVSRIIKIKVFLR